MMAATALRNADVSPAALNERSRNHLPGWYGMAVDELVDGAIHMHMTIRPEMFAPNGYLHAASVIALADTACGYGCVAHLPAGATSFTTIELKSNFLGSAKAGIIRCRANLQHGGRTTQVWDAAVTADDTGATLALFRCTQMVLWPRG
jgi:1,4-dihydroxy-2-naphthoyl-CoA hydrolase